MAKSDSEIIFWAGLGQEVALTFETSRAYDKKGDAMHFLYVGPFDLDENQGSNLTP